MVKDNAIVHLTTAMLEQAIRDAWDAGFYASGEGYNGEYLSPTNGAAHVERDRAEYLAAYEKERQSMT